MSWNYDGNDIFGVMENLRRANPQGDMPYFFLMMLIFSIVILIIVIISILHANPNKKGD